MLAAWTGGRGPVSGCGTTCPALDWQAGAARTKRLGGNAFDRYDAILDAVGAGGWRAEGLSVTQAPRTTSCWTLFF